jgi:hypothetical protein
MSSSSSNRHFHPSIYLSFSNMFWKAVPTQSVANPVRLVSLYCTMRLFSFTICNTSFFTLSVQLSYPFFSCTKFQNFQGISDLLLFSGASKFQHHTKLCSKFSSSLVSSLKLSLICWWTGSSSRWTLYFPRKSWI